MIVIGDVIYMTNKCSWNDLLAFNCLLYIVLFSECTARCAFFCLNIDRNQELSSWLLLSYWSSCNEQECTVWQLWDTVVPPSPLPLRSSFLYIAFDLFLFYIPKKAGSVLYYGHVVFSEEKKIWTLSIGKSNVQRIKNKLAMSFSYACG